MSHGMPDPPHEPPVDKSLDGLAPKFRAEIEALLSEAHGSFDPVVSESNRTLERQEWLFGFGREYDDGRGVVTQAQDNTTSWHGYGLAVDIISKSKEGDAPTSFWQELGARAMAHGLVWGGSWTKFQDRPHVQWGAPMRQAPSQHAADLLADGGMQSVWQEVEAV